MAPVKPIKSKKGFSFIELVVVMAIMSIVGATVAGLLRTGLSASGRISEDMAYETEARTALSLITVKLRQYDATGAIDVISSDQVWFYDNIENKSGTAIRFKDGGLYSYRLSGGIVAETGEPIAYISGFEISDSVSDPACLSHTISRCFTERTAKACLRRLQRSAPQPKPSPERTY